MSADWSRLSWFTAEILALLVALSFIGANLDNFWATGGLGIIIGVHAWFRALHARTDTVWFAWLFGFVAVATVLKIVSTGAFIYLFINAPWIWACMIGGSGIATATKFRRVQSILVQRENAALEMELTGR